MSRDGAAAPPDVDRRFFVQPILTSPYEYPARHWELDEQGQPTQRIIERRRTAQFITPIPKPRKRKGAAEQREIVLDEGKGLSTEKQQYDPTPVINQLRNRVDAWRSIPNPDHWGVTPETRRLLQHWRHHPFASIRPFFCQIEAIETVIWLTEGKAVADDSDLEEVYNTERHLLYVACTRARDHLLVTAVAPASEFLDDLKV